LERHRFLAILLSAFETEIRRATTLLEVAPTPSVTRLLEAAGAGLYVGIDLDPTADGRNVQVIGDLCLAPFVDGAFDASVCFHVFEHIPDDRAAMSEYSRLLSPIGIGFVQAPWKPDQPTVEDPSASPEERRRRFGQADHVRMYGGDFEDRMRSAGLEPRRVLPEHVLSEMAIHTMGLTPRMPIWLVFGSQFDVMPGARFEKQLRRRVSRSLRQLGLPPRQFGSRKPTLG
jgi:SAM-dependent methyltransferase